MELLQKITLYDLFGYALPGCVLLYIWKWSDVFAVGSVPAFTIIIFAGLGYLVGLLISEISEIFTGLWKKSKKAKAAIEKKMEIAPETIGKSLASAGVLRVEQNAANANARASAHAEDDYSLLWNYFTNMYADIQTDKNCSRLHNYASAELLYKNMACVSAISVGIFLWEQQRMAMFLGAVATVLFLNRWYRFAQKKVLYTVYWYVARYLSESTPRSNCQNRQ